MSMDRLLSAGSLYQVTRCSQKLGRRLRSASVKTADQCCPLVNHVEYTFTRLRSASVKTADQCCPLVNHTEERQREDG